MTENHGYNTPAEGTTDWHVPLNENFDMLDIDAEIRDSEANLDDYTPKSGAKFLAVDTGNRFIGDGSEWNQLAYPSTGGSGGSFDAAYAMPDGYTLAAIADAVARSNYVRLEPGATYSGDTTIEIDPRDRDVYVDARGAEVEYSGSDVCVLITENYSSGYRGRVHWLGGAVVGPGRGTGIGFRIQDSFAHDISPDYLNAWDWGVEIRNVDQWSEGNRIRDIMQVERCERFVRFNGAEATGGSGTDSFRFTRIENIMGEVVSDRFIEMTETSAVYDSRIRNITGFLNNPEGSLITVAGAPAGTSIEYPFMEPHDTAVENSALIEFAEPIEGELAAVIGRFTLWGIPWSNVDDPAFYVSDGASIL